MDDKEFILKITLIYHFCFEYGQLEVNDLKTIRDVLYLHFVLFVVSETDFYNDVHCIHLWSLQHKI